MSETIKILLIIFLTKKSSSNYLRCTRFSLDVLVARDWMGNAAFNLALSGAQPFEEGHERHETFIVLGFAQFLHQVLGLFLGQLLTQVGQQPEEFLAEDGVVVVLVVELQDLDEIVDAAGVLGVLGLLEHGVEVVDDHDLLALLLLGADFLDGAEGGVQVAGAEEVADVEGVDLAVALEVIDVESELDLFDIPGVDTVFVTNLFVLRHVGRLQK